MPRNLVPRLTKRLPYPTDPVQNRESDEEEHIPKQEREDDDDD